MVSSIDLKQIERKAYRSTYQDGLWDIYMGVVVVLMGFFLYHPESGYSAINIITMVLLLSLAYSLFWAGKKYITLPRMGQVRFGPIRQRRKKTMAIILGVIVLIQFIFVGLTAVSRYYPQVGGRLFGSTDAGLTIVAAIGSLFVGLPMLLMAYMNDFPRGYYIAVLMSLAVFLMILTNQPLYPAMSGILIIIPGVVLLINFLKKYPLPRRDETHE